MTNQTDISSSTTMLATGRDLKKEGKLDDAIEVLARACEAKMNEEGNEIFGDLADYLIEYADVLLCKEESNSGEIFSSLQASGMDAGSDEDEGTSARLDCGKLGDVPVPENGEDDALTDLQLAWESFEHARLCLLAREESCQRSKDLSFVHCRLGDIQALQEQFLASISDYGESVKEAIVGGEVARKVAGLLVSLSQTVQVFMMSEECKSEDLNSAELVSNFQSLFKSVADKYAVDMPVSEGTGFAMLARDGFLLAHTLLQSVKAEKDVEATMAELAACAADCLQQEREIEAASSVQHGVTSSGFAKSSGSETSANVITVSVKRKAVVGESDEAVTKKAKDDETSSSLQRADKAKLVD